MPPTRLLRDLQAMESRAAAAAGRPPGEAPAPLLGQLDAVSAWVHRRTRDIHLAEDIVQDTALIAITRGDSLREPERFRAWLFRVAQRRMADQRRRRAREEPLGAEPLSPATGADAGAEADRLRRRVLAALRELPDFLRRPIRLHYLKGQSLREIAARLETSVSSVKTRLYRARKALRDGGML